MIIKNGKNTPLNANSGTLPQVDDAMLDYFQPMTFGVVTKTIFGAQVSETMENVSFQGVMQPLSERQLMMKPEGQRLWKWFWLHADPSLTLTPDMVVTYLGEQFRVTTQKDYRLYGYVEYHLTNDYTGAGPEVVTP